MSWRQIILHQGPSFIEWVYTSEARLRLLSDLARCLEVLLIQALQTRNNCESFWNAIPLVRTACNFNDTYELPLAVEAYAYVHFLDRYWRTWDALIELTAKGAIPLGVNGVCVLDVGTGPAPTPYAIQDFYSLLSSYGQEKEIIEFARQKTHFEIVESSISMRHFMHIFSEHCFRPGPFGADMFDFAVVNPPMTRKELLEQLKHEEYYDASVEEYYSEYSAEEANIIAQRHQRYRMIVFSNFFTLSHTIERYEAALNALLSDLQSGSTVIIIGGKGNNYEDIYRQLTELSEQNGLKRLVELRKVMDDSPHINQALSEIKRFQHTIFQHLVQVAGTVNIPKSIELTQYHHRNFAKRLLIELPKIIRWPDYWSPEPSHKKKVEFLLHVYRKGRWPK